ncbi:MAG: TonB-dependent receptor [Methylococcales bacterium]|nr:TonB-dependent receptor [Methylococcales bacterium]
MKQRYLSFVSAGLFIAGSSTVNALNLEDADKEMLAPMIVEGDILASGVVGVKPSMGGVNDAAALLKKVPGANVNSNGPLSGIAQYRGLFGDRVNVNSDGTTYKSACANAMDAPLSHVPTSLTESMSIKRGIASVSSGIETMGGSIMQRSRRGEFAEEGGIEFSGKTTNGVNSVNSGYYTSIFGNVANKNHKFRLGGSREEGGNYDWHGGLNVDTSHERNAGVLGYGYRTNDEDHEFDVGYNFNDTHTTGTPSLPMDIVYSRGGVTNVSYKGLLADKYKVETEFQYQDIKHRMDNYTLRGDIAKKARRQSNNTARGFGYKVSIDMPMYEGSLLIGTDADNIEHDAQIRNPFNAAFSVNNFNDVERDRYGFFAEWKGGVADDWDLELGTRLNWIRMDAKSVGGTAGPFAAGKAGAKLASAFNAKKHDKEDLNVDVVAALTHHFNDDMDIEVGFGRKTRSPSYQERYLWLPLNATGGLADGRNYIGNIELQPEVSYQAELGFNWQVESNYIMPRIFYRYVENYIQGTPTQNAAALKIKSTTLEYTNVDAYLFGFDVEGGFRFLDDWKVDAMISYVRGRRDDVTDNLYRIAPLNGRIGIFYDTAKWLAGTEIIAYDDQNETSSYNDETPTPGYFIWNLRGQYRPQYSAVEGLQIGFGIENVLDESHRVHLSGLNRNPANDGTAVGEHLPGVGRNFYATLSYDW